jgi:hypothetical protein
LASQVVITGVILKVAVDFHGWHTFRSQQV